jgi:predicted amidohydrolase YtcJ
MTRELRRIPLLRDRHTHPFLYAALHEGVNLNEGDADRTGSREELRSRALRRIREHAERGVPGWAIAHGWNNGLYSLSKQDFDDLPPLVVFNLSLHTLIVNDAGRALLQQEVADAGGNLDDQGWIERNLRSVLNIFANAGASAGRLQRYFQRLLEECGVYYAEEMLLVDGNELRIFEEAALTKRTRFWAAPDQYDRLPRPIQGEIHGIKLFTDGALGAWTAALHQPYRDRGGLGMLTYTPGELEGLLQRYLDVRKPIAVHAIGDRAIDQVVSAVEAVRRPAGSEIRIEHAQLISETTARRAKEFGIVLCMQPNFSEDSANYAERLPEGYPERNNPFRMLIDRVGYVPGVDLLFGSDGMPHGWRYGLKQSLFPQGGYPGQTLTVDEFVAGYCLPDCGAGHIEVEIDRDNRQVTGRVVLG